MRVLACGGVGVLAWEGLTGQLSRKKTIEVRTFTVFIAQANACLVASSWDCFSIPVRAARVYVYYTITIVSHPVGAIYCLESLKLLK